jgi:hypothetical protein
VRLSNGPGLRLRFMELSRNLRHPTQRPSCVPVNDNADTRRALCPLVVQRPKLLRGGQDVHGLRRRREQSPLRSGVGRGGLELAAKSSARRKSLQRALGPLHHVGRASSGMPARSGECSQGRDGQAFGRTARTRTPGWLWSASSVRCCIALPRLPQLPRLCQRGFKTVRPAARNRHPASRAMDGDPVDRAHV